MTQDLSTLEIVEVRADDPAAVDEAFQVGNEAMLADYPEFPPNCRYDHDQWLVTPMPGTARHTFLGRRDGEPVGTAVVDLPLWDNLDKAMFDVSVVPVARRRGVGQALYVHAAAFARDQGRRSALGFSTFHVEGFAHALGLESKLTDVRRRLDLSTVDDALLDRLYAEGLARAAGYSVVRWGDRTPDELLADVAALDSSFIGEAPLGELDYEPEQLDADRIRQKDEVRSKHGRRTYNTGVLHDASGRLVAWSAIRMQKTVDWHAWQQITLVSPEHRGHRLGVVSKIENLRYIREAAPSLRVIDTFNAEVNVHMIAINEAMGFQVRERWANWQGPIDGSVA
ncbi:GNAT family N-acetyltransferase [Dactylosporangium sp. AC04546]|uniref:GNAT family N-acetyltransferase n=1 Tax=Dactylosporangium sp. AC04546 TaxID=2862460 RepID=UPI001EDF3FD0|nr:GNAT family N-acetyltransferase [Dactylosporangium sp. AC04546]WVK84396.1 GNAT family N-acetyltransferase [Dactylosporangium sp. AC04546]